MNKQQQHFRRVARAGAGLVFSCILVACGGGSGGNRTSVDTPPPPPPVSPTTGNNLPGPRPTVGPQSYVNFESGQVRPIVLSADGQRLFAVNTPDARLEIFAVGENLTSIASVPVGLDPVAIAEDPGGKIWVVNHLSDSVSIIDVNATPPRVVQTLWVGDEPRDIVFAGSNRERAFITTAHRGQNSPVDPALNTPSVGRADVWVFDSTQLDDTPGGQVLEILTLFGDRPRPLAVSADGLRVFVGIFMSGSRTTTIPPRDHTKRDPTTSADNIRQPDTGLIVHRNGSNWVDEMGQNWNNWVPFTLPDYDVFEIDATTLTEVSRIPNVGTILFNMVVNPVTDVLYVSNIKSRNRVRFSGPATRASTTVRGHVTEQQITVIDAGNPLPRILNKHIDRPSQTGSAAERNISLSTPLGMAFTDFAMRISYPPNPIRQLDNQPVGIEVQGEQLFQNGVVRIQTGQLEVCVQCHTLDPAAGLFGSKGLSSDNSQTGERNFKIPHFRDQYQKVGMFGFAFQGANATGPQVRGFSFNHNGATSSNFIIADLGMPQDDLLALRAFLYTFPTESPPVTGQQVTLSSSNSVEASDRIDLLIERALVEMPVPECDLVAKGVVAGIRRGWLMQQDEMFRSDIGTDATLSRAELETLVSAPDDHLTFTCTPWGSGLRMGIDRDLDSILDGDEG